MAYDRVIRAELFKSQRFLLLPSDTHRLVFIALVHEADDFGNIEGGSVTLWLWMRNFTQVKTEQDAIKIMSDLADRDLVRRYEFKEETSEDQTNNTKEYWHVPRFRNTRTYTRRVYPPSPWCDSAAYTGPYKGQSVGIRGNMPTNQGRKHKSDSDLKQTSFKSDSDLNSGVGVGVGVGEVQKKATGVAISESPKDVIFTLGVSLLQGKGENEKTARSFLARLAKGGNEKKLAELIARIALDPKIEPKSYLVASMRADEEPHV